MIRQYQVWGDVSLGAYCLADVKHINDCFGADKLPYTAQLLATFTLPDTESAVFLYRKYLEATGFIHPSVFRLQFDDLLQDLPIHSRFTPAND